MSVNSQQAPLKIKCLIVGGGIAGLACSYALRLSGHETVVVDQHGMQGKTEGCIQSPPNMTRILARWPGMASFLLTHGTRCTGLSFRQGKTSEPVGFMKFHHQIMSELEAEFLVIQHNDLRRKLYSLCSDAGVLFKDGKVTGVVKSADGVRVRLENGEMLRGTIVVGADGHNSFVRSFVMDEHTKPEHIVSGVNISIPTRIIREDEEFSSLCKENEFTIWMGSGSSITGTLNNKNETFNLAICSPTFLESLDSNLYESHDLTCLRPFDLSGYDPKLQKLIKRGKNCRPTVHKVFKQEDVVGLDGSIVLVGDAAHSIVINGSHNASMAVEDAVTLGTLFSHLSDPKQIPIFTETYEELRLRRTNDTRISEYQSLVQISLPPGPLQEGRDAALKLTLDQTFEDFENCDSSDLLVQAWEQYIVLFSHDASEAVENWWSLNWWAKWSCGEE
ncbi:FAD-binding-3 domain-containing protein [Mycena sanguinolenta]|uniref:FAD-binding-3 domain-containing protein n=1 Tax=Mycena sanguinolenta TaxID=230812 RepID=A0A8H6Y7C1_9AGAR|nr:FAD-binding-3 domain-containing protein [Mycena sanguinolenta]